MMIKQLSIVAVILMIVSSIGEGRHIGPKNEELTAHDVKRLEELLELYRDREEFRVKLLEDPKKPWYVPFSSARLTRLVTEPCDEEKGFRRDILGICREVWD